MATGTTWGRTTDQDASSEYLSSRAVTRTSSLPVLLLRFLASLKITVALFALGIFIILVGTLAQVERDMWEVIDVYFRSWFARIELQLFFPRSWFPKWQNIPGAIWFPGGALIGTAMAINLVAAHSIRFKAQAKGGRLAAGLGILAMGTLMTGYIIVSGHNHAGLQGEPPFSWQTLWLLVKVGIGLGCAASIFFAVTARPSATAGAPSQERTVERRLWWLSACVLAGLSLWLFISSENAYLGDSGMRILWQLIQSTVCGLVLLAGSMLVFGKRGGVVLIHAGVGLMMFGQFFVSKYDVEEQMRVEEGQTKTYGEDIRRIEMAIVDSSNPTEDQVVVVPKSVLLASYEKNGSSFLARRPREVDAEGIIRHESMPFDIQVLKYYRNADVREAKPGETNLASAGFGKRFVAEPVKPASGTDMGGGVDFAAAYVRLMKKDGLGDLGTFLLSQLASFQNLSDQVTVGDKKYELALRFRRSYKPYQITLKDVRKDDYVGTSTPRNYSSDIHLVDSSRGVDREIHIWMNNPLRYAGETFYQSGYQGPPESATESTTLSIVTNAGWMIPYVSCMIVFVALCAHFGQSLLRFLRRQSRSAEVTPASTLDQLRSETDAAQHREKSAKEKQRRGEKGRRETPGKTELVVASVDATPFWKQAALPALAIAPFALMLLGSMISYGPKAGTMDLREFGRLPVIADGRVKPFDTLARNTLRVLSNRETFRDAEDERQPAIAWLLDVMCQTDQSESHRVIRIDNLEVLDLLGLQRRASHLYSISELRKEAVKFEEQVDKAQSDSRTLGAENLSVYQRKLLELDRRVRSYTRVAAAFQPPSLPPLPTREEFESDRASAEKKLTTFRDAYLMFMRSISGIQPPLAVPTKPSAESVHQQKEESWQSYAQAWAAAMIDARLMGNKPPEMLQGMNEILASYSEADAGKFNAAVINYRELLKREKPKELQTASGFWNRWITNRFGSFYGFEEFFNHVAPFYFCWWPYLLAGVLAAFSWLGWTRPLNRVAYSLIVFAFVVHTIALGARIYISGRPPVTNLYSSAVFIGWAVVLFCLIWERIHRDGIAIFLASALGFGTLLIAHMLAGDGDTFTVLQAVLDTQFWLATHVVTVTLGYAATFLAGSLGIVYVLRGLFTPSLNRSASQNMARMIYGTTCFAMLFSFIGTVLGGLWADDSWGRFWGWDPKENGALIIVLWNALVLHASWDGMVKDRGLAVLSVGGNIVTSWSWFGVNELGVGLHSYGFTEGVMLALGLFVVSQIAIILAGSLPKRVWWSFNQAPKPAAISPSA